MLKDYHTREDCRLCQSDALTKVFSLTPTPPANAFVPKERMGEVQSCYPLDIYHCAECAHVQLPTVVKPDVLFRDYVYVSGTSAVFVEHFKRYANQICQDYALKPGQQVVDVGSNDGTLLNCFKQLGMQVLGIDPAISIAAQATASGIETWPEFFGTDLVDKIIECKAKAKVICANNVFAHTDRLVDFVRAVKQLMAQDGVFVFEVSYLVDVYEKTLFDMTYHEHVAYHSVCPLIKLFEREGLALIDAQRVATHGGSLRGIVQHQDGPFARQASVQELVALEHDLGFSDAATLKDFGSRIDQVGQKLKQILTDLKSKGCTIVGYGAPAKATTLMYHFSIDGSVVDYIVDDSPLKQDLLTPGLHIPVLSSAALEDNTPDYILILAWNFADSIIAKYSHLRDKGCKFIVPLPTVEIL